MNDNTAGVRLVEVEKRYQSVVAVRSLSLEVPRGTFFSIIGPSGCGKKKKGRGSVGVMVRLRSRRRGYRRALMRTRASLNARGGHWDYRVGMRWLG